METITKEKIKELLDSYFQATTSLEEEKLLRNYFATGAHKEFEQYKPLFACFNMEIEALDKEKVVGPKIPLRNTRSGRVNFMFRLVSVGAAAAIVLYTFIFAPQKSDSLRLFINGEKIMNQELAISMANDQFSRLNSILGKYQGGSEKLESLNRAGDAISPLFNIDKLLKQNRHDGRLEK